MFVITTINNLEAQLHMTGMFQSPEDGGSRGIGKSRGMVKGRNMTKTILGLTLVSLVLFLGVGSASAQTQISMGGGTQVVTFTSSAGSGSPINVSFASCTDCGVGNFQQGVSQTPGTYDFTQGGVGPITMTSTNAGASFDIQMNTATLAFDWDSGSNFLDGSVTLVSASDNTSSPKFVGTLLVTSSSYAFWSPGDTVKIDFVLNLGNPVLDNVFNHTNGATTTSGDFSSGQALTTPEPFSFALLGSGLIMLGGVLRRRLRM
jgi:hypothetical protein